MRHLALSSALLSLALILTACGGGGSSTPTSLPTEPAGIGAATETLPPQVALPGELDAADLPQLADAGGMATGALGVYYLERDPANPALATLTMPRLAQAPTQGDLFALSIRPFMGPQHLLLTGSQAGPDDTTDYSFRFLHPFPMPTNLDPPQSASKRVDLFIFDVTLVVMAEGSDTFFGSAVTTNLDAMPTPDGFRQVGPLLDPATLGVSTANTFPYRLLDSMDPRNPAGNYDPIEGWIGDDFLNPSGYDVVAQGASIDTTLRIANAVATPLPLVVLAKYMDPRNGNLAPEKRENRLPSADPTGLRYFLPEAAGDIQHITASVDGILKDSTSEDVATVTVQVRDWDNSAETALNFPDHSAVTKIAERSRVQDSSISVPELKAGGGFNAVTYTPGEGLLKEYVTISYQVANIDLTYVAPPEGADLDGLIRIKDSQDFTVPAPQLLDEALAPVATPVGFEPSTRYQKITVPIIAGLRAPVIESIEPLIGMEGTEATLTVNTSGGPVETWDWVFTTGISPSNSTDENPTINLESAGTVRCAITVANASGADAEFFDFIVTPPPPDITGVTPAVLTEGELGQFRATNIGGPATDWDWYFDAGAVPGTSIEESPSVIGGEPGTFQGRVTATNVSGQSDFDFTYTVLAARPPLVTEVLPVEMFARRPVTFTAAYDPTGGIATDWEWDFGGGCTPNTSTDAEPLVKSGMPGIYDGTLRVSNAYGETTFDFTYTVKVRLAAMNVYIMTSGSTYPTLWWEMASWSQDDVRAWFRDKVNPIFAPAGVALDIDNLTVIPMDRPDLYNLDSGAENSAIFNMLYHDGDWDRLNFYIINRNNYSGWAGVMSDLHCNYTNANRGCIAISYTTSYALKVAAHELGHVFNLPHTRTSTNPMNSLNFNLMGYGTSDVSLLENVLVNNPGSCAIWPGNPHSQYQVTNDWFNQYSGLPE